MPTTRANKKLGSGRVGSPCMVLHRTYRSPGVARTFHQFPLVPLESSFEDALERVRIAFSKYTGQAAAATVGSYLSIVGTAPDSNLIWKTGAEYLAEARIRPPSINEALLLAIFGIRNGVRDRAMKRKVRQRPPRHGDDQVRARNTC